MRALNEVWATSAYAHQRLIEGLEKIYVLSGPYFVNQAGRRTYAAEIQRLLQPFRMQMLQMMTRHLSSFVHACRYFMVPFMLVLLHMEPMKKWQLAASGVLFTAVNSYVLTVFMYRTFTAPDGSVGRFMW